MAVEITQDEMNILNLNGISAEDVRANVEYSRATGLDDDAIRQQFSGTIERLKPITKVSANDTGKIKEWQDKGAITPFELGQRKGVVFDGTYSNIDNSANLSPIGQRLENSAYNDTVEQRIQAAKDAKAERNQRVNDGTASFFDRAGAALDRWGEKAYQSQLNAPEDITLKMAGVNKPKEDKSGEIGFAEALGNSFMTGSWLPFVGGYIGSADTKKEREIAENIRNGKPIRQDELNFINHRIEQRQEESVRGYTLGGHIAESFMPSLVRFGGEIATGQWVLRGLGLASELPAGATLGQKVVHGLGEMGKTGLVNTALPTGWSNTFEHYQERMLQNEFDITDKGQLIFQDSAEKPATAFMKSLGKTFVMFSAEASGELIGIPVKGAAAAASKYAGTPISNYLKSNKVLSEFAKKVTPQLSKLYEKMNNLPIKGESVDWLKSQVKFDGFIEELGEEVLEDVLNLTIGTDNQERTLENYAKAIFKSPDEWAVLAGAVALQGGTLSVASHLLGKHLEENGATDEQIVDILQNLSETEKEELIDNIIDEGLLNIDETEEQHFEKTVSSVAESLLQSGKFKNKANAEKAVRLGATMLESMSKKTGKSLDDLIQEDMAEIEEVEESAYADENGRLYAAIDNAPMTIQDKVDALMDEYSALPEGFDDMDEIDRRIREIDILSRIESEELSLEDVEFANDMIADLEAKGETEFAQTLRDALNNENKEVHFQRAGFAGAERDELPDAAREWKEKGTESKYFKNWFGNSKVVDESGKPLVVYHGTADIIEAFDESYGGETTANNEYGAFFFCNDKEIAEDYSRQAYIRRYEGRDREELEDYYKEQFNLTDEEIDNIIDDLYDAAENQIKTVDVYLKMENPIIIDNNYDVTPVPEIQELIGWAKEGRYSDVVEKYVDIYGNQKYDESDIEDYREEIETRARENYGLEEDEEIEDYMFNEAISEVLDENGIYPEEQEYDGIIIRNTVDDISDRSSGIQDTYIVFKPEQIKSVGNKGNFDSYNPNIYFQHAGAAGAENSAEISDAAKEWEEKGTESKYFKRWFDDSKVTSEDGKPLVVYHGSVNTFDVFDKDKASAEGDMGAGFYFTDNEYDVDSNYFDGGADFDNKVERLAERIQYEEEIDDYDEAKEIAEQRLRGESKKFEVYLRIKNPCYVGSNETYLLADVFDDIDISEEDYEDYDEYEDARRELEDEKFQQISYDIDDALGGLLQYDDIERARAILFDYIYEGGVTLQRLKDRFNEEYFENWETGELVSNEVARRIVEALGYDGIIDDSVSEKFSRMGLDSDTTHYIVFNPEQVKSVENRGEFDSSNPNMYFQAAYHGTPHKFDKFSLDAIGSGEGFQAHGWGLYFAEDKNISEAYRRKLTKNMEWLYDGKPIPKEDYVNYIEVYQNGKIERINFYKGLKSNFNAAIQDIKNSTGAYKYLDEKDKKRDLKLFKKELKDIDRILKLIDDIDVSKYSFKGGQLYEVDIPESDVLLDEQAMLIDQSEFIQESIERANKELGLGIVDSGIRGGAIYDKISNKLGSEKDASLYLNRLGVKGISYDGKSDGKCYVIFDDEAIEITQAYYQRKGKGFGETFAKAIIHIVRKIENANKNIFTVQEMLPHVPMFNRISDFFADIQDVKIELVSDNEYKNGKYIPALDSIKLNKDSLKMANMPIGRIETLLHELQHAKQKRIYDKYQALLQNKSKLSAAEIAEYETYCKNYDDTGKANSEKNAFYRKYKKELAKIKRLRNRLSQKDFELELLRNEKLLEIDNKRRKLYDNYRNSFGEVDARETAKQLIYRMGYGDVYENQYKQFIQLQLHSRAERARGRGLFSRRGTGSNGGLGISSSSETQRRTPRYFQEDTDAQSSGQKSGASTSRNRASAKQRRIFIDNDRADEISNRFEKIKGTFIPAENLIALFKDADESTIIHEFAHWWLEKLVKYAAENEELQDDLAEVRKFLKNDGEPFTTDQHERFARGFEAYMRTGSARTNRLKKLFEDFKNALLSLYDSIKELGFEEDEIPEINNLFERLLTTENQRIQAAVFDKCNAINEQIKEIRENQLKEFADIEEIERNNLERNLQDNKRKQQIKEYLRLAQKAASRIPKGIREYQERYKQATLEILEVATGYKRQFIANPKNWEIIEQKIADLDDQITVFGGMQSNWTEFYIDTGVSYYNDEIDGDYKLAEQAFKILVSGNYSPINMEEEEIGRFFGMFDYLEGKVMTLKGENKSAAYEALCSLFNEIPSMPDEAMQELVDKLQAVGERFLDQKSMERTPSLGIPNVSLAVQFRTYVTQKLHNMKAYDPESKRVIRLSQVNRLYTLLKFANSVAETKQIIRNINNHAIEQLENRQKLILHKEIQKQVRINSKLMKVGALKRGKFDWKTNTVFSELQTLNRLSLEDAQKEYQRLINADAATLGEERESVEQNPAASLSAPTEFQAILKTKFLEYKSNRVRDLNLAATRSLLEDIMQLKFEGRRAKNRDDLKKALSRYDYETDLVRIAYLNKQSELSKYLARWVSGDTVFTTEGTLANWESLLTHIFDRETAQKYSLLKSEADVEVYAHKKCLEFYNKALDIYGLRNIDTSTKGKIKDFYGRALDFDNTQPIIKLFQEYENEGHTYKFNQFTYNKDTNDMVMTSIDLTHAQIITLYAWSLNSELKKRIMVQFVGEPEDNDWSEQEQTLEELMFSKLSNQDKEFAQAMIDICDSMYDDTNEVFIRTTGLSLPRVENYIPSKTERIGSDLDMLHENVLRSTNPSFIKQRRTCRRIKMEPVSPLEIILPHINKTSRYIVMSEKVNFYNRIFQSPDVKAAILDIYGKKSGTKIYRVLLNQLATSTYENYARAITVGKNLMDTIASNYITSRIGGNIKVFLSQLTSVINYAENMPAMEWAKGFKEALAHPKETVEYMFNNCPYLQARLAGNSQNEVIASLTNESDKMRSLRNFCTANTKYGDIIAIIFGGKPYVDYLMKNVKVKDDKTGELRAITQEEAFERFVESTLRSQQSGHNSATSAWQKQAAQNALTRMVFAFNNTNFQYERKFVDALANYNKGSINKQEFIKAFLVYKVFNPIMFSSFLTNLSIMTLIQNLFGGGDDDPFQTFGADVLTSIALSNWKAYGMLGVLANSLVAAVAATATNGKFFESSLPLITDFEKSLQKLLRGKKLETGDYVEILAGVGDYTTGVATTRIYNTLGGVGDIAEGELGKGFLRILGYGNYRASVAATGQEPDKRK